MNPTKTEKTGKSKWQTTREPNLLKNADSGRYYARFVIGKKQRWINLETDVFTVARLRISDKRAEIERSRLASANVASGLGTFGELAAIYQAQIDADARISDSTRKLKKGVVKTLLKTWPGLEEMKPDRLTRDAVIAWRDRIARDGTGYVPPGARGRTPLSDGSSASRINKCLDCLRTLLEIASDRGQLGTNFLANRRGIKLPMAPKKPNLPEPATIEAIFDDLQKRRPSSASLCRFLASTGCRLGEARAATWQDVDFQRGILRVRGTKTDAADREIPLIPSARSLLEKLNAERHTVNPDAPRTDPVLTAREAGISLATSCKRLNVPKLTHHDLRDAFATRCIESGVDVPTVAAWLGHKDGGALLMRVYAHHRRAHSLQQAAKVL